MKTSLFPALIVCLISCNQQQSNSLQLQGQVDSLRQKLDNIYTPGLGEFMSGIQIHHAKLWFAGANNNWKLADFEIHEIGETLEDIQKFNADRPEVKSIGMVYPAIDSLNNAIKLRNQQLFKSSFVLLTESCNNCHRTTQHEFNIITIPLTPPVSNQSFKVGQ